MVNASNPAARPDGRHRRHLKNYLLDREFQLKYAGYFVAIALVLSVVLGLILWTTANELLAQSRRNVDSGRAIVAEGHKVSHVVEMNIVKDPDYGSDPALLQAFKEGDKKYTERLELEQRALEAQALELGHEYQRLGVVLLVALGLFVILVALAGILVTHRVAGPIYKMKRLIGEVTQGRLQEPGKLRRGDELVDFFSVFDGMVRALRTQGAADLELLRQTMGELEGKVSPERLAPLARLIEQTRTRLGAD